MANLLFDNIKKQASSFMHDKYQDARLILTDVTEAELLVEEVTSNEPGSPDAKTMTRIAEASYDIHDFWRIVDVLQRRLQTIDWKQWRQAYKSLVLLEFLLTHGPGDFADEFDAHVEVIQELGTFKYKDDRGVDWGIHMKKRSEKVLELLQGGNILNEARLKALRITNGIQGFGNDEVTISLSSSSSPSSAIFGTSSPASIRSSSSSSSGSSNELMDDHHTTTTIIHSSSSSSSSPRNRKNKSFGRVKKGQGNDDSTCFLESIEEKEEASNLMNGICSKLGISPRGSLSYANKFGFKSLPCDYKKKDSRLKRQLSIE